MRGRSVELRGRSRLTVPPEEEPQKLLLWALWPVALAFMASFIVMTWPWLSGRVTIPWDAKAHFQPQIRFLADSLARGEWPFWNPFVFAGQVQIADPQSMIFSPPFLLLALVNARPSLWAADVAVLASMFGGGVALIAWFRDRGWHWAGALIAAIAFSFGAAMAWRIQHITQVLSLAYLPLALFCLDRAIGRGTMIWGAATGFVVGCIVLGRDQVALLCVYLLAVYALWQLAMSIDSRSGLIRRVAVLGVGAATWLAVVAIPVTLTALLAGSSNRPIIDYLGAGRGSLHPALLLTALMPDVFGAAGDMQDYWGPPSFAWRDTDLFIAQNVGQLYIGAIPLLLIMGALVRGQLWGKDVRFFLIAASVMLLYALGWFTPAFRLIYELVPGVSLYRRPADAVFLIGALGAILAGYAGHLLFSRPWDRPAPKHWAIVAGIILAAFAAALLAGLLIGRVSRVWVPLLAAVLFLGGAALTLAWARGRIALEPRLAACALAGFASIDLAWNNGPNTSSALPPAHYDVLEPTTRNETIALLKAKVEANETRRDRIELAGLGFHWPNASITHRLENTLGYNPLRLGLYSKATGAEDHVGLPDQRKFAPLMPSYRSRLADLLGLRFIATGAPVEQIDTRLQPGDLSLITRTSDAYVYENSRALPRVLFAQKAFQADFGELIKTGAWPEFDPMRTVLLEQVEEHVARQPGSAAIESYGNSDIVIVADSPDGGWVVLNDVWQPWWTVAVDDRDAQLLRANVLFRAVQVPPGRHVVRFTFRPLHGAWGDLIGSTRH
jgi:hypothetical protein